MFTFFYNNTYEHLKRLANFDLRPWTTAWFFTKMASKIKFLILFFDKGIIMKLFYSFLLLFIDHIIKIADIRKLSEPLMLLQGHKKAVSYVQFLNDKELVSAYVFLLLFISLIFNC